jgi:hypothetical protein
VAGLTSQKAKAKPPVVGGEIRKTLEAPPSAVPAANLPPIR